MSKDILSSPSLLEDLGNDIAAVSREAASLLSDADIRHVFLDRLILPSSLDGLTPPQVITINRFRERERPADGQFAVADFARLVAIDLLLVSEANSVLEIGMGKFPIQKDHEFPEYFGVDIDPEAIEYCLSLGYSAGVYSEIGGKYDAVLALYSLHFHVGAVQFEQMFHSLADGGVLIAVVIDDEGGGFSRLIAAVSAQLPLLRVLVSPTSRRSRWIIAAGPNAHTQFDRVVSAAVEKLSSS